MHLERHGFLAFVISIDLFESVFYSLTHTHTHIHIHTRI
jgi:hypothetical protein